MEKPRIVFPFVEAGFGHIMAERSICDAFERKYGEYFEVVRSDFYTESGNEKMIAFEKMLCEQVRMFNKCRLYGYFTVWGMNFVGTKTASEFVMKRMAKGAYEESVKHLESLRPDAVVSTHWATNYYAEHLPNKPFTATFVPDAHVNAMFRYPCDLTMISVEEGYARALKRKRRYTTDNLRLTTFAIRQEAFSIERDKHALRQRLGHDDKFTVYLTEGGYGVGLTEKLCAMLLEADLPITVIAVCGKNPEMHARLQKLKAEKGKGNTSFYPYGFCNNALELIASSDLYLGKSGSGLLEPAFFGVPIIVTHSANDIERLIADYYVRRLKNAKRIFRAKKCLRFIEKAYCGGEEYARLQQGGCDISRFGGEGIADILFEKLNEKFHVKEED